MTRHTWTALADTYVPSDLRETFLAEAEQSIWKPPDGEHPFSPGLALKDTFIPAVRAAGLRAISHVAYSQGWTMREDNYRLEPYAFDRMISAVILGVRSEVNGLRFYGLDLGTGVAPIVLVDDTSPPHDDETG